MLWALHIIWIHALATTVGHLGDVVICEHAHFNWIHASDELLSVPLMSLLHMIITGATTIPLPWLHQT
jgi:hypothetical protein